VKHYEIIPEKRKIDAVLRERNNHALFRTHTHDDAKLWPIENVVLIGNQALRRLQVASEIIQSVI
jgi:hypothetical protein